MRSLLKKKIFDRMEFGNFTHITYNDYSAISVIKANFDPKFYI